MKKELGVETTGEENNKPSAATGGRGLDRNIVTDEVRGGEAKAVDAPSSVSKEGKRTRVDVRWKANTKVGDTKTIKQTNADQP